jgi:hypothetical protein
VGLDLLVDGRLRGRDDWKEGVGMRRGIGSKSVDSLGGMAWFEYGCRSTARRIDRKRGVLGIVWPLLLLLLLVLLLSLLVLRREVGWIHLLANGYDRFKKEAQITDLKGSDQGGGSRRIPSAKLGWVGLGCVGGLLQ